MGLHQLKRYVMAKKFLIYVSRNKSMQKILPCVPHVPHVSRHFTAVPLETANQP